MQFKVKITETFERIVCVEAHDKSEAVTRATEHLSFDGTLKDSGLVFFKVRICEDEKKKGE